jgi:predicted ester cyclase
MLTTISTAKRLLLKVFVRPSELPSGAPATASPGTETAPALSQSPRNKHNYLGAKAAFNRGDLDACMAFYARDHQIRSADVGSGREHILAFLTGARASWSDLQLIVQRAVAEGEWVMGHCRFKATHSQTVFGVSPTGRAVETEFWDLHRFDEEGLIRETWNISDQALVMRQLTALGA